MTGAIAGRVAGIHSVRVKCAFHCKGAVYTRVSRYLQTQESGLFDSDKRKGRAAGPPLYFHRPWQVLFGTCRTERPQYAGTPLCKCDILSAQSHRLYTSGNMLMRTIFHVLVGGTHVQNFTAPFSDTLYIAVLVGEQT
jgi:hypothetical protein